MANSNKGIYDDPKRFPITDCYVENLIKSGYERKCSYPDNGIPKLKPGKKAGVPSPAIAAFGLDRK
ncbi:MAG: hypothetical protein HAW59_04115 [Betaproteobacteria bacterium]|nr:hypothetical protein [Betaproteobacteria bacterium]